MKNKILNWAANLTLTVLIVLALLTIWVPSFDVIAYF